MTKVLLNEGLRIGKKELGLIQDLGLSNLAGVVTAVTNAPAVVTATGTLGTALQVTVSGTGISVAPGSALLASGIVLSLASSTTVAVTDPTTNGAVVLSDVTTPFLSGTMALAADRVTLTYTGSLDLTTQYAANDYIRLDSAGDVGSYRIQSVTAGGIVLAEVVPGSGTMSVLNHAPAGKYFPGYPLTGTTRDLLAIDAPSLRVAAAGYTPLANEIVLAKVTRAGATVTVVDQRVAATAKSLVSGITDAQVAAGANIAGSKLDAATQAALAEAHVQNTDTFTTSRTFRLGSGTGARVLTTDDLAAKAPTPTGTWPAVAAEKNVAAAFVRHGQNGGISTLQVTWGIRGTAGTPTAGSGTQTVTISSPNKTGISSGDLVGQVLYDAAGAAWAITANTASAGDHSFILTTSQTNVAGNTGAIAAGAAAIQSAAANVRLAITHKVSGTLDLDSTYVERAVINAAGYPTGSKISGFVMADPGETYTVQVIGARGGVEATATLDVTWGTNLLAPTVNVPSTSISAVATASTVTFTWPAPTGFDTGTMDYSVAVVVDGLPNPAVFQTRADVEDIGTGAGLLRVPCGPGQLVTVTIRVVDLAGTLLSNADGTKQMAALSTGVGQFQKELFPFTLTGANFNVGAPFIDVTQFGRPMLGGAYEIGGIQVDFSTFNVSPSTRFKCGVYPASAYSAIVWSDEMGDGAPTLAITPNQSSYPPLLTQVRSGAFNDSMKVQLECTSPDSNWPAALTGMTGTITVFYRPTTAA